MWLYQVSNPGSLALESDALPTALRGPAAIIRYKRTGYNINLMQQSAGLVVNPITVNNFASLLNRTPIGRAKASSCI